MKIRERDKLTIEHIAKYCDDIKKAKELFGNDFKDFITNSTYRHACTMCILQIGELSKYLSDDFKTRHSDIPWGSISAMRNVFAHNYGNIDLEDTWNTMIYDIPFLKRYCDKILDEIENGNVID